MYPELRKYGQLADDLQHFELEIPRTYCTAFVLKTKAYFQEAFGVGMRYSLTRLKTEGRTLFLR